MGRYPQAEPLYKQAIAIRGKALGEEHPDYARSLNNLGVLYKEDGAIPGGGAFISAGARDS